MGSRRWRVSSKSCLGCTRWTEGTSYLQSPLVVIGGIFLVVVLGALQGSNEKPTPDSLRDLEFSQQKQALNLPLSSNFLWGSVF